MDLGMVCGLVDVVHGLVGVAQRPLKVAQRSSEVAQRSSEVVQRLSEVVQREGSACADVEGTCRDVEEVHMSGDLNRCPLTLPPSLDLSALVKLASDPPTILDLAGRGVCLHAVWQMLTISCSVGPSEDLPVLLPLT